MTETSARPAGLWGISALAPFASPPYRYLWLGAVLIMSCQMIQLVAQGWLIYEITDSPTWLGIVSFARGIPMIVLSLPAGVLVDRLERRGLLIVTQALSAAATAALAGLIAARIVEPWHVALNAFVTGALIVAIIPAHQALIPTTVPRSQSGAAVTLASAGQNAGRVLGPALAGLLVAAFGVAACFFALAAAFTIALLSTFKLEPRPVASRAGGSSAVQNLLEGLGYIRRDPTVLGLMTLAALPALLLMPYQQLLPVFARDILRAGPEGLGWLMGAAGVGSVVGTVALALAAPRRQGLMLFAALFAFGTLLVLFAMSTWLPASILLMGLIGMAQAVYMAANYTLLDVLVPDKLRGRVMSAYITTWGLIPIGTLPQGILVDRFGAPAVEAGAGVVCCAIVALLAARSPALRRA